MTKTSTLEQAQSLHQAGKLDEAETSYLAVLNQHPQCAKTLHALGILHAQQSRPEKALEYLTKAAKQSPHSPNIYNHLGNTLKKLGRIRDAIGAFKQALALDAEFAQAYNNLGAVYFAQNDDARAIDHYQLALKYAPEYPDAHYNLGMVQKKMSRVDEAMNAFSALLTLMPLHFGAHYHMACLYMEKESWDTAIAHFTQALGINAAHHETHVNLGHCYLHQNKLDKAIEYYQNTLLIDATNPDVLHNLAHIAALNNNSDLAIQYYCRIVQAHPNNFSAHNNLGVAFLKKGHPNFALKHFEAAKQLNPNNTSLNYIIDAIKQDKRLEGAPKEYIKNLFDSYAKHFESHLLESLDYHVPEQIHAALTGLKKLKKTAWTIGDLGCGTGLSGILFKPYAKKLIGIDLSQSMLEQAKKKSLYDELICDDIDTYLTQHPNTFDLLVASDVLVYYGKLDALFERIKCALTPHGVVAFSLEAAKTCDNYTMMQSGRFSHSETYIQQLAKTVGFTLLYCKHHPTRSQYEKSVDGLILILQNAPNR